jgi:hypothetical protein
MNSTGPDPAKPDRTNFIISFVFHGVIVLALVVMAAHEGLLGKQLKKIAVEVIHEKPPEKPKEPEKPKVEPPRVEPPKAAVAKAAPTEPQVSTPPPAVVPQSSAIVAPAAAELPAFAFDGGKIVQSSSDPIELYRGYVESALRSKWNRPTGITDDAFVAEIEITVSAEGQISKPEWKKNSGNQKWDDSVNRALASARSLDHPPPARFPDRVLVRFDVQDTTEPLSPITQ